MENKKIIASWSKIKPDDATHERILNHILDRVHSGETKKGKIFPMIVKPIRILTPIAACFIVALAISITMLLNNGGGFPLSNPKHNGGSPIASLESPFAQPTQPIESSQPAQPIEPSQSVVENPVAPPVIHMNSFTESDRARLYFDP